MKLMDFPPKKIETKTGGTKWKQNHLKGNAITGNEYIGNLVQRAGSATAGTPNVHLVLFDHTGCPQG